MRYKIYVRQLVQADANKNCPFPVVDDEAYRSHMAALVDDVKALSDIQDATLVDGGIVIKSSLENVCISPLIEPLER